MEANDPTTAIWVIPIFPGDSIDIYLHSTPQITLVDVIEAGCAKEIL
jgi:hypothetical protein